ncbi:hypothetical protein DNTS_012335 [Danionella cerebrum]|uniref:Homeobox domain-containing protein n=1 Tax=Danionella cerebrum TaxID=2873325 RepID=A0A553NKH9_9TELE|nr:hypothetical protein DNTS_012335 [Danionella translucida]
MADWKMPVSYNFNPAYHAYAYGLVYPQVSEHGHPNLGWPEAAYAHSGGVTASYFSAQTDNQSPPWSQENGNIGNFGPYSSHTQNGRLFLSYTKPENDVKTKDAEHASSDTPSDSEAHTPDSWSSGSSRDEGAPLTSFNQVTWRDGDETDGGSPEHSEQLSNSTSTEESQSLGLGVEAQPPPPKSSARLPAQSRKTRVAFSEEQMSTLISRFTVQRYLTPAEMKTLASTTGLTYKQVKTWFQNRRMKLKRHQRDSSWMTERYVVNAAPNTPASQSQFQTEMPQTNQDPHCNPQLSEPEFKRSPPQMPFYSSYLQPCSPPQTGARTMGSWPPPPAVTHYDFPNPLSYMHARDCTSGVQKGSSPQLVSMSAAGQWTNKTMTLL